MFSHARAIFHHVLLQIDQTSDATATIWVLAIVVLIMLVATRRR